MTRTMVLSDCGHPSAGPSGVLLQSSARMRSPISPPPAKKSKFLELGGDSLAMTHADHLDHFSLGYDAPPPAAIKIEKARVVKLSSRRRRHPRRLAGVCSASRAAIALCRWPNHPCAAGSTTPSSTNE